MNVKNLITRTALALCFVQLTASSVLAQATVTTDKEDYAPGTTAYITASGLGPPERNMKDLEVCVTLVSASPRATQLLLTK